MRIRQRLDTLADHKDFPAVLKIVETLANLGHQTVLAGGCVRDGLLGLKPKDLDVATAAPPEVVEQAFPQTLAVGKVFGTIVVLGEGGRNFEVTTFRKDGEYQDGRHPNKVDFSDIEEDAKRRDFTVNALFYDPVKHEVMDFVGGLRDIKARILETVGDPDQRFTEDHLRMLRAVRFVGQLGFLLDAKTLEAIQRRTKDIAKVSSERIFNEMKRLLESRHMVQGLKVFKNSGLHKEVWPEIEGLDPSHLERFPLFLDWENAFSAISLLTGQADVDSRLKAWKVSRESARKIALQMQGFKTLTEPDSKRADRARVLGGEVYAEVLQLAQGLIRAKDGKQKVQASVDEFLKLTGKTGELPKPLINGQDLLSQGIEPGEEMGRMIKALFEAQLEGRISTKNEALAEIKNLKFKV